MINYLIVLSEELPSKGCVSMFMGRIVSCAKFLEQSDLVCRVFGSGIWFVLLLYCTPPYIDFGLCTFGFDLCFLIVIPFFLNYNFFGVILRVYRVGSMFH